MNFSPQHPGNMRDQASELRRQVAAQQSQVRAPEVRSPLKPVDATKLEERRVAGGEEQRRSLFERLVGEAERFWHAIAGEP